MRSTVKAGRKFLGFSMAAVAGAICLGAASGQPGAQESVRVVTSIKPVHSLAASVMAGVGAPYLIVKGSASPHTYALKPSDARALERARLVFWVGRDMEVFLEKSIETLAAKARVVELEDADGLVKYAFREDGAFEAHEDEDKDHAREDARRGESGKEAHEDAHGAGETDMHFWLDPENAKAIVREIESALAEADPANAAKYKANAQALERKLEGLKQEISAIVAPVRGRPFIVFHDAYRYFEKRFGVTAAGSITVSPETLPGAKRLAAIKAKVAGLGVSCVFSEPQFAPKLVEVVIEGSRAKSATLDPLGTGLEDGPGLYFELMRNMANSIKTCLSPSS